LAIKQVDYRFGGAAFAWRGISYTTSEKVVDLGPHSSVDREDENLAAADCRWTLPCQRHCFGGYKKKEGLMLK